MKIEVVALGAILGAGALFFGFPLGVAVGYAWRDRISRELRSFPASAEARRTKRCGDPLPLRAGQRRGS